MEEHKLLAQLAKLSINIFHVHQDNGRWIVEYEYKWGDAQKPRWSKAVYSAPRTLTLGEVYGHMLTEVQLIRGELGWDNNEQ